MRGRKGSDFDRLVKRMTCTTAEVENDFVFVKKGETKNDRVGNVGKNKETHVVLAVGTGECERDFTNRF